MVSRSTAQRRLGLLLFSAFSAIALLLAFAGIYGVLAGSVAERTREFGLRTAMGATPGDQDGSHDRAACRVSVARAPTGAS